MLILMQFLGFGAKNHGGWSNSQGKIAIVKPFWLFELLGMPFSLAKFR